MINQKEFNTGNLINYEGNNVVILSKCTIEENFALDICFDDLDYTLCSFDSDLLKPIILTHELLINNCGFTQRRCQFTISVGGESLDYFEHESGFILWYYGKRLGYTIHQFVRNQITPKEQFYNTIHELQNLFWVMKKQELQINL